MMQEAGSIQSVNQFI